MNALFELRPEDKIGLPFDQESREVVCIITHKRSFDGQAPQGQMSYDQRKQLDQCVLKIEQKHGLIYDQLAEEDDDEVTEHDWYYELAFSQFSPEGAVIPNSERIVRAKATEMVRMLHLVRYCLPALNGWHAIFDPSVVAPAGSPYSNN